MCGIVGLFLKDKTLEPKLGALTDQMLETMCDRGPDSAGFAVYGSSKKGRSKITVQSPTPEVDFKGLDRALSKAVGSDISMQVKSTHCVLTVPEDKTELTRSEIKSNHPSLRIMAAGDAIEIYKEVGYPTKVSERFGLAKMSGTHAIGQIGRAHV